MENNILQLQKHATDIRLGIIEAVYNAKSGHPGGALSSADILACLYFSELNINPMEIIKKLMNCKITVNKK